MTTTASLKSLKSIIATAESFKGCTLWAHDADDGSFVLAVNPNVEIDDDGNLVRYRGDTAKLNDLLDSTPGMHLTDAFGETTSSGYVETWSYVIDPDMIAFDLD